MIGLLLIGAVWSAALPVPNQTSSVAIAEASDDWSHSFADADSVYVGSGRTTNSAVEASRGGPAGVRYEERRLPPRYCGTLDSTGTAAACVEGAPSGEVRRLCADGSPALPPLQRRELEAETGMVVGPWVQVDNGGCPEDPVAAVTLSAEEFRRLPLTASAPSYQPADGQGLVNVPLIVFTDPLPQVLQTVVLGVPVTVRATPVSFSWDFGDGSAPLVTSDAGAPHPEGTVSHAYTAAGSFAVRLLTTWRGEFRVNDRGPWLPVIGTAQTVSVPFVETVVSASAHLVAEPLPGR